MTKGDNPWDGYNERLVEDVAEHPPKGRLNREQVAILAEALSEHYCRMLRLTYSLTQHTLLVMLIGAQARHNARPWSLSQAARAMHQSLTQIRYHARQLQAAGYLKIRKDGRLWLLIPTAESVDVLIEHGRWHERAELLRTAIKKIDEAAGRPSPTPEQMLEEFLGDK